MTNEKQSIFIKYSAEQIERFCELYKKLTDADKRVEEYKTNPALNVPVLRKRFALLTLGEHLPNYEKEVPQEIRDTFSFDVEGLVKKVKDLL